MPQHPKKLLDQVGACPELVETVATPTPVLSAANVSSTREA
jgi:hypothetical protein